MTLLVAGADPVDAGKTTFAAGLTAFLDTTAFKPRAGNDYWFDHDDVRSATTSGRLYGKDATRLAAASEGEYAPEELNPIHRLWRPVPGPEAGLLGDRNRKFLIDRVGDTYVRNATVTLPSLVREHLPVAEAIAVSSVEDLNEVMQAHHLPALDDVTTRIERTQRTVVESYSDVARPLQDLKPAAVAVVEPRRVRIYAGERYAKACSVASGGPRDGQLETRVGSVLEFVDPLDTVALDPLSNTQREEPGTIATAYREAYDALVDAAR